MRRRDADVLYAAQAVRRTNALDCAAVFNWLAAVADRLPQVVQIGAIDGDDAVDFLQISRRMIGTGGEPLFTPEDMQAIRDRMEEIQARIRERSRELESLSDGQGASPEPQQIEDENAERVEEIRQSVTDEAVRQRVERIGHEGDAEDAAAIAASTVFEPDLPSEEPEVVVESEEDAAEEAPAAPPAEER